MLYNSNSGFLLVGILFMLSMISLVLQCPCDDISNSSCVRREFYGVQLNHFAFFAFLGFFFPSYVFLSQGLGIVWEYLEYLADINDPFIEKYLGGCLMHNPKPNSAKHPVHYIVYRGEEKYLNPIDKYFGIQNSRIHGWHGSVAEIVVNIIGFAFGYMLNRVLEFKNLGM